MRNSKLKYLTDLTRKELLELVYNQANNIDTKNKQIIEKNEFIKLQAKLIEALRKDLDLYKVSYCKKTQSNYDLL